MKIDLAEYADLIALMQLAAKLEEEQQRIFDTLPKLYGKLETADRELSEALNQRADVIAGELAKVSKSLEAAAAAHKQDFEHLMAEVKASRRQHAEYAKKTESEIPAPVEQKIRALFAEMPKPQDGKPGEPGAPGRDANLADNFRGNWDNRTAYKRGDTFTFRGSFYLVTNDVRGVLPTVKSQTEKNPYYAVLAVSGAPGLPGAGTDSGGGGGGIDWSSVPASASASGTAGSIAYSSTHFYVCVATNTWRRVTLASWS